MDKLLLDSLNNLSFALEQLAKSLDSKNSEAQSAVGTTLQSGDFSNQMVEINKGIQLLRDDTKKIIENQDTILKMQKQQDSKKTGVLEEAGQKKNLMKDGIGSVLLIAGAVLAIGLAFSIIGSVDWKSVIALSISLPLLAMAFEKISSMKELSYKNMLNTFLVITTMSLAITTSSYILSGVKSVSTSQLITIVLIAASFSLMSISLGKLVSSFNSISTGDAIKASILMPLLLTSVSIAIAASSYFLDMVKPIGISKAITSVLIAGVFTVLGYGVGKLLKSFEGVSATSALTASFLIPILLVAISYAIAESSSYLSSVKPIGIDQAFTSILIAATFTVISYGMGQLLKGFNGISASDALLASLTIPLLLIGISAAIVGSSYLIKNIQDVSMSKLITFLGIGLTLSIVGVVMGLGLKVLSKIGKPDDFIEGAISVAIIAAAISISSHIIATGNYNGPIPTIGWSISVGLSLGVFGLATALLGKLKSDDIIKGSMATVLVSGAIMISSIILSFGSYENHPPLDWAIGVGLSLGSFGLATALLGKLNVGDIIKGSIATILVSGGIMVSSLILSLGSYEKYPSFDWAIGVGLSLGAFGLGAVLLGAYAMSPTFYIGLGSILLVAGSIVATSYILGTGSYEKYPSLDWATGVGLLLGAFGLGAVLLGAYAMSPTLYLGLGAILLVAESIVATSYILGTGSYEKYPSLDWATNIGLLMGGFSVGMIGLALVSPFIIVGSIAMLMLAGTILAIDSIFESGNFTKYPGEEWVGGVKKTITSFTELMSMTSISGAIGGAVSDLLGGGLTDIAESIIEIDRIFDQGNFTKYPSMAWGNGVLNAISKFNQIKNALGGGGGLGGLFSGNDLQSTVSNISQLAIAFDKLGKAMTTFSSSISSIDDAKLASVKSLSSTVVLMSLMNPDQFDEMMDAMEEKSGVFGEFINDFNASKAEAESGFSNPFKGPSTEKTNDFDILGSKLDKMNTLLSDIISVVGSKGVLKSYLNSKGREVNLTPTTKK